MDDIEANLKPARDLGMVTILVRNTTTALQELETVTGMKLLETAAPLPAPYKPSEMSNGYVPIKVSKHTVPRSAEYSLTRLLQMTHRDVCSKSRVVEYPVYRVIVFPTSIIHQK